MDTLKTETNNFVLNPSLYWKPLFLAVVLHLHAWTYGRQVGLCDSICDEVYSVYSVCCQGYQKEENYSSLT